MVAVQYISTRQNSARQLPGTARGDMVLQQDDLPAKIHGWHQTAFEPAKSPEHLPEGQYWWVHLWEYAQPQAKAVVTFDQLGLSHWHELTDCYKGNGWILTERTIETEDNATLGSEWEYVIARFNKSTNEQAILVFSTFYEDGTGAKALQIGLDHDWEPELDFGQLLRNRILPAEGTDVGHTRALQCQVFAAFAGEATHDLQQSLIDLHLASRTSFRTDWLRHIRVNSPAIDGR